MNDWINPRLATDDQAIRVLAATDMPRLFIADDVLTASGIDNLRRVFQDEACWIDSYGLFRSGTPGESPRASREEWVAAPPDRRFWSYREFDQTVSSTNFSASHACLFVLRTRVCADPLLMTVLARRTGIALDGLEVEVTPISLGADHFQAPHSDARRGRRLCGALYLSDGWRPGFGGEFRMTVGTQVVHTIEPRMNRLVLFDPFERGRQAPATQSLHHMLPLEKEAGTWIRHSVSVWWVERDR